ncbi:FAD-binding oxidoreductase [Niveispirillum cyanobacteriorum]|nr:FAD-binding oxidoreductase [Niveispirillum cyanobacteriorum]GGE86434.1 hypothetical protein GCM10011317_49490 [Niveispirillum cyanobacteriorum]
MPDNLPPHDPITGLTADISAAIGADRVSLSPERRALFSQDIWSKAPHPVDIVVTPTDTQSLAHAVRLAAAAGLAVLPRGGGMSYTGGYVGAAPPALLIDMSAMDRVLSIDPDNMRVTVEAGCTWKALHAALSPLGLRTPFWGPLSGISSTVGGGLSQQNAFFGAGLYGTTSESIIGLRVVLSDGTMLTTGARRPQDGNPFYRFYGPDLTGLFCGDCGALGIKAEITLRLMPLPAHEGYLSFSFGERDQCLAALADVVRSGIAAETCAFDPALARVRMKRASMLSDVKALGNVIAKQKSIMGGVREAARIALAGRSFIPDECWSLHLTVEGRSAAAVEADLTALRAIGRRHQGAEVENTIPKVLRAQPFTPLNNVLGPAGERWVPVHGIVAPGDAIAAQAAVEEALATMAVELTDACVTIGYMLTSMSTNSFLIEPVFFWPEAREALHEATVEPGILSRLPLQAPNPTVTALVARARKAVVTALQPFGAAHFQVGRTYPLSQDSDPAAFALLRAIKASIDPDHRINPGVLGLQD